MIKKAFLLAALLGASAYVMTGSAVAQEAGAQAQTEEQQALVDELQAILDANPGMTEEQAAVQLAQNVTDPVQKAAILQAAFSMVQNPTPAQRAAFTQAALTLDVSPSVLASKPAQAQSNQNTPTEETGEETGATEGDTGDVAAPPPPPVVAPPAPAAGTGGSGGGSN